MAGRGAKLAAWLAAFAIAGFAGFWAVTAPRPLPASALPQHAPDIANGRILYNAAGCRSCHKAAPELALADPSLPAGGTPLKTPIGTLYPPNLTPDPATGLGTWSDIDFVNAVQYGISPDGRHLIPAFPYASYAHMRVEDVLDIRAYLATLPPVVAPPKAPAVPFVPLIRRGIGLWKLLGLDHTAWQPDPTQSPSWNRGAYLVNGPGHCGECHTPRDIFMVPERGKAMAGGPHPGGEGKVPSLLDLIGRQRYTDQDDLASALADGETGGYDHISSGGMGEVQTNLSMLPKDDIAAIAEYLVSLK